MKKIKRLAAAIIDIIIIIYICHIPRVLIDDVTGNKLTIIIDIFFIIFIFALYTKKDCIIGNESIGKKIMKLKIYQDDKVITDKKILTDRVKASLFTFPLYPIAILTENKSNGDEKYNTEVK